MVQQLVFHLFRCDLLATPVDLILLPPDHCEVTIGILYHQIAGAVEALGIEHPGVVGRALVVTAEGIGATGVQGARLAGATGLPASSRMRTSSSGLMGRPWV